ncbi:sulfate transporter family-domain-containing protein [Chaetomium strumarium]|uniref:Sulfate transporter family-domain-containing protein n=1 Tax=Chaetomium strumarium TaxID=1170767 RepID=A0AAJ0M571_9PEZI|nr:sulfate transporter family-domain-containing protein [Chaetomium strumarium]
MRTLDQAKEAFVEDFNWKRARRLAQAGTRALPGAAVEYVVDKFPIVQWLPRYNPRWLVNDVIAGLTLGLMLIPQGLSYAKIATVPVQYGLMSSWLPSVIYAFMGTTKDLSTGPTSLISLLTAEIIKQLRGEQWSPSEIASAVAVMIGIYGLVIGLLKLGFLLELISLPILSGFISAVAITIALNQMDSLLGEPNVGDGTATQIHDIFQQLPQANVYACAVGFTGILFLTVLDQAGKRWGKKNRIVWFLSITRAFITLVIFTGVGYAVNRSRGDADSFLFEVVQVKSNGQEAPRVPNPTLLSKVAGPSVAVFIGSAVEHTAIARGFGVRNHYVTDQSQELTFYGVANIANSFFHAIGVGGAMSRTAVNSACNVKSPLSGFVTTAVVLVSIFKLVGTLYWIPKATLAAIIICAVWPLISPPSVFYRYWRTSLADFVSAMLAFWVSLFVSTEIGIATSVGFNIVYVLLRQIFAPISTVPDPDNDHERHCSEILQAISSPPSSSLPLPSDTRIFHFTDSVFFPNAYAIKTALLDTIKAHHAPVFHSPEALEAERNWSVSGERRLAKLRRKAGIRDPRALPPIGLVVVDFGRVNHIDATACAQLEVLLSEIRAYGGEGVAVRFAGMSGYVRQRFVRAGWRVVEGGEAGGSGEGGRIEGVSGVDKHMVVEAYRSVVCAVTAPRHGNVTAAAEKEGGGKGEDVEEYVEEA